MYEPDLNAPPINPLPPVVIVLVCLLGGVELVFQAAEAGFAGGAAGIGWRIEAVQQYAFSDSVFDWMRETGQYSWENMLRFLTYPFLHQSFMHTLFAVVFVLAIGKFVSEVMNSFAVLLIFFASSAIGAALYSVVLDQQYALIGAYPAVFGLIGAFTWLQFSSLKRSGQSGLKAFTLILFFLGIALLYKFLFGGTNEWLAEMIGFCVGFALSIVLGPDGKERLQKVLLMARQR
ncbi:rhomboid family intramembrane serine protease [Amylibacter sp. SFDW26]|uniref:rhomboid family intramembrane serine protease n=1 Tax=Amylibacter sp. SFDW26 TaxID=2652722 RepID=UPI00126156AA|nr:rhomboid family intramembrane serine protease [Amylibacter sp. SFDW26]KAB7613315.1 rhomboid family intramembrane serine protease [Amylibacter sp. SFDW26]